MYKTWFLNSTPFLSASLGPEQSPLGQVMAGSHTLGKLGSYRRYLFWNWRYSRSSSEYSVSATLSDRPPSLVSSFFTKLQCLQYFIRVLLSSVRRYNRLSQMSQNSIACFVFAGPLLEE